MIQWFNDFTPSVPSGWFVLSVCVCVVSYSNALDVGSYILISILFLSFAALLLLVCANWYDLHYHNWICYHLSLNDCFFRQISQHGFWSYLRKSAILKLNEWFSSIIELLQHHLFWQLTIQCIYEYICSWNLAPTTCTCYNSTTKWICGKSQVWKHHDL